MHSISFFSRILFDEIIAKGGKIVYKVDRTLANSGGWEKKYGNVYLRGRACIESVRGSLFRGSFEFCDFDLFLALLWLFAWFATFRAIARFVGFPSFTWSSYAFLWLLVF
jgi:hypothetical protein